LKNKELQMTDITISTILMDRASGWKHNYYSDTERTSYDLAVERAMVPVRSVAVALAAAVKATAEATAEVLKKKQHLDSLTAKKGSKERIDAEKALDEAEQVQDEADRLEAFLDYEHEVMKEDSGLLTLRVHQLMERYRNRAFRRLRNQLQLDGDVDAMKEGVALVMNYTNSWLEPEDITAYLSPLRNEEDFEEVD